MRLYMQESRRYVVEHGKGQDGCDVSELARALQSMPNGWIVKGIHNRDDGTTIVHLEAKARQEVKMVQHA